MRARALVAGPIAAALLFSLTACGDDSGGSLSLEDWQSETEMVCTDFEAQIEEAEATTGEPGNYEEVVELIDTFAPINEAYVDAVIAVGVPDEMTEEVEAVHADLEESETLAMDLRAAAVAEDDAALTEASEALNAQNAELDGKAEDLGVPACAGGD